MTAKMNKQITYSREVLWQPGSLLQLAEWFLPRLSLEWAGSSALCMVSTSQTEVVYVTSLSSLYMVLFVGLLLWLNSLLKTK